MEGIGAATQGASIKQHKGTLFSVLFTLALCPLVAIKYACLFTHNKSTTRVSLNVQNVCSKCPPQFLNVKRYPGCALFAIIFTRLMRPPL